jgi:hypothetical protein
MGIFLSPRVRHLHVSRAGIEKLLFICEKLYFEQIQKVYCSCKERFLQFAAAGGLSVTTFTYPQLSTVIHTPLLLSTKIGYNYLEAIVTEF